MSVGSTKPGAARNPLQSEEGTHPLSPHTHSKSRVCSRHRLQEFCTGMMTIGKSCVSASGQWANTVELPLHPPQLSRASRRGTAHRNFHKNIGVGSAIVWAGVPLIRSRGTGSSRIRAHTLNRLTSLKFNFLFASVVPSGPGNKRFRLFV